MSCLRDLLRFRILFFFLDLVPSVTGSGWWRRTPPPSLLVAATERGERALRVRENGV